jgi:hypothetical protein
MAGDDTINVYFESNFFDLDNLSDGSNDADVDYSVEEADNIGERNIVLSSVFNSPSDAFASFPAEYNVSLSSSGFYSTAFAYQRNTAVSGVITSLVEYSIPATISGLASATPVDLDFFINYTTEGHQNARVVTVIGDPYVYSDNILHQYWIFSSISGSKTYDVLYTAGNDYDPSDPLDYVTISGVNDYPAHFSAGTLISGGSGRAFIDSRFAGYVYHFKPDELSYKFNSVCGLENILHGYDFDSVVIPGSVLAVDYNVYSTVVVSGIISDIDACCGLVDLVSYSIEGTVIPGGLGYQDYDLCCGSIGIGGFNFDIDLLSLKISNFSLVEGEYTAASGTICVDITDDVYNVVTSGTHFIIGDTVTSGTFDTITDGYTMCYDPVDNFASIMGATTFTVHAQNDNGDVLEKDYYLTSGYMVEYDNRTQEYDYDNQVVVRMTAENFASCPADSTYAYWFTTEQQLPKDLTASIVGVPWGEKELTAEIYPQTDTMFVYGKVFNVEVRAKDFSGNVMPPYVFEFRIEDKPE